MQNLFQNLLSDDRLGAPSIAVSSGSILQFKLPLSGRDVRVPFDVSPVSLCILPYSSVIDTGLAYGSISARFKVKLKTFGVGQTPGPFEPKFNCFLLAILLGANRNEKKYDKNILAACHKHLYWSFVNAPASGQAKKKNTSLQHRHRSQQRVRHSKIPAPEIRWNGSIWKWGERRDHDHLAASVLILSCKNNFELVVLFTANCKL